MSRACRVKLFSLIAAALLLTGCETTGPQVAEQPSRNDRYTPAQRAALAEIARINTDLASSYYSIAQYTTAFEVISKALAADPGYAPALVMSGLIYAELRDLPQARAAFQQALRRAPTDPDVRHNYGVFLCKHDNPAKSIEHFNAALSVPTYNRQANTYAALGSCFAKMGRDDESLNAFRSALLSNPLDPAALIGLASLQYQRDSLIEASELMGKFNRVSNPTAESLWLQVRIARKLGRAEDERIFSADLRNTFPDSEPARLLDAQRYN